MNIIICRTNGTVEDMTLTEKRDLHWYGEQIGAQVVEIVHPTGLKEPYLFMCDEEGRLKKRPVINFLGSWLYGTQDHGSPIVGDIIIAREVISNGERDIGPMSEGEADVLADWLVDHFWEAHDAVMARIGRRLVKR